MPTTLGWILNKTQQVPVLGNTTMGKKKNQQTLWTGRECSRLMRNIEGEHNNYHPQHLPICVGMAAEYKHSPSSTEAATNYTWAAISRAWAERFEKWFFFPSALRCWGVLNASVSQGGRFKCSKALKQFEHNQFSICWKLLKSPSFTQLLLYLT